MRWSASRLAVASGLLLTLLTGGCAEMADRVNSAGSKLLMRKTPEQTLHIKTPADRIKELKKLAKTIKKRPPAEQQQLADNLTKEYQQESEPILRRRILRTLAACRVPSAGAVVVGALADPDIETRRVACKCLGERGDQQAISELARVVGSETEFDVRIAAVHALGTTRDRAALVPLSEMMVDSNPAMQKGAREALTAVSGRDYGENAQAWREYAKNGTTTAPEVSIAERVMRTLF
ncbi:MAG TPA: HEAT repeat domain-containing protein [Pirellulales bacterium]|jgi:HEAT repeat protein|nr:HEAT repeat domain-containing protein [Pirellulales bacterium]